jgi:hypothetical protein
MENVYKNQKKIVNFASVGFCKHSGDITELVPHNPNYNGRIYKTAVSPLTELLFN